MKKIIAAVMAASLVLTFAACGDATANLGGNVENIQTKTDDGNGTSASTVNTVASEEAAGYYFTSDGVRFTVDMNAAEVVEKLGSDYSYYEAASCAFDGLEKTYTYKNFQIGTYEDGDLDRISMIYLTNDMVATEEGIAVGDEVSKVEAAYSNPAESSDKVRTYEYGSTRLTFILTDGKVTAIEYSTLKIS